MTDEHLDRVSIDITKRQFILISSKGVSRTIDCDDGDEFIRVLDVIRNTCETEHVVYL
tara:strand:- start:284 stop:457 length:174 start_codon:yes stop_codon:yes gene_type:complete